MSSSAGGQLDLWIMDADGQHLRQLTSDAAAELQPCVSSDGKSIVFVTSINDKPGIWLMNLDTARFTQLTDSANDVQPLCAPSRESVVFSRLSPESRVYRVSTTGGAPELVSDFNAGAFAIAPDGRHVASLFRDVERKWVIGLQPLDGMKPIRGFDIATPPTMLHFTPSGDALTFLDPRRTPPGLWNQPIAGGEPQPLVDMHGDQVFAFAWSRDGRLAVAHGPVPKDVVLISGIR